MGVPAGYFFTREHEWVKIDGNRAKVGISDYAQHKLGDITFVDLPTAGKQVKQFEVLTGIESVKAASDIYAPVSGKVTAVNSALESAPEAVNKDPYNSGWMVELEITNTAETANLMDSAAYDAYVAGLE
ncbi:MAG: glycine cleavage system protein GcvH [Spirochaetia bacterium]|nr:glycine cleavage system protein GcvH [Spirochaetia bacterium]